MKKTMMVKTTLSVEMINDHILFSFPGTLTDNSMNSNSKSPLHELIHIFFSVSSIWISSMKCY